MLNDVKNPIRTLKVSASLGLGICAILYCLANVAFFAYVVVPRLQRMMDIHHHHTYSNRAATNEEIKNSGVIVAALFFENVFGTNAERALSVIIALR